MKIIVIDNYDSFTYNLVHMLREFEGVSIDVRRNDQIAVSDVQGYEKIVLSPGPGIPSEAGAMPEIVREYAPRKSILGVCLGHQCIGEIFGGTLRNLSTPIHGKATTIQVADPTERIFKGFSETFKVGRYHSWVVQKDSLPPSVKVTAVDESGEIMALRHETYDVCGVQFHPESILTPRGHEMLKNWIEI
jgi:anthranilate synthase component 2